MNVQVQSAAQLIPQADHAAAMSDRDFQQALRAIAPHLRAFARSLCGCAVRADDLAQETMMRAWAARDRYTVGTNFKAWTFTILRNQYFTELRRERFTGEYDEGVAEKVLNTSGNQQAAVELVDVLRALESLPASHREALILLAAGGLSYEEISEIAGVAIGTVKSRICRARSMLVSAIESGQLPDYRHNFVLTGEAIDAFFAKLGAIPNFFEASSMAA